MILDYAERYNLLYDENNGEYIIQYINNNEIAELGGYKNITEYGNDYYIATKENAYVLISKETFEECLEFEDYIEFLKKKKYYW